MQLMRLNHNSILLLQLLVLYASTCLTVYSQNTQMKFMGFSMGMSSVEVIGKLISQDEITAYANGGHQLARNDRIELFRNTDTIIPYHENRFKFNCPSFLLGTPNPNNIYGAQEFSHFPLYKLIFNQFEIKNPSFVFEGDNLVGSTGQIELLFSDYNELVTGLDKKYGKGVYNNYLTSWTKDGSVITLWAPIYEQWKRNKKIKVHDNQYKSNNTIFFQFYSLDKVRKCKNEKEQQYEIEESKFITLFENKIYLLGFATGATKDNVFKYLSSKYSDVLITSDQGSVYKIYTTTNPWGYQTIRNASSLPDSFLITIPYKDTYIDCRLTFLFDQLYSIGLSCKSLHPNEREFNKVVKKFASSSEFHPIAIHNDKNHIWDELYLSYGHDSLYMRDDYSFGLPTQIILKNNVLAKLKLDKQSVSLSNEIFKLLNDLKRGGMLNFTIGLPLEYNQAQPIPLDFRKQWINISQDRSSYSTYEYDVSYLNELINADGKLSQLNGYPYCCYADIIQLYIREGKICSISTGIRPLFYNTGQQLQKVRADIIKEMIKQLTNKYGEATERSYAGRKSLFWIIDSYIFELILESKQTLYSSASFNESFAVFFSFRVKDNDDLILKRNSNKGLLD
jgi:hypothetical protein